MRCFAIMTVLWVTLPSFTHAETRNEPLFYASGSGRLGDFQVVAERVSDSVAPLHGEGYRFRSEMEVRGPDGIIATHCWWNMQADNHVSSGTCVFDGPEVPPALFLYSASREVGSGIILTDKLVFLDLDRGYGSMSFVEPKKGTIARYPVAGPSLNPFQMGLSFFGAQSSKTTMAMAVAWLQLKQMDLTLSNRDLAGARRRNSPTISLPLIECPISEPISFEETYARLKTLEATDWEALLQTHDSKRCIDRTASTLVTREPKSYQEVRRGALGLGFTLADSTSAQDAKEAFSSYSLGLGVGVSLGFGQGDMLYLLEGGGIFKRQRTAPEERRSYVLGLHLRGQARYSFLRLKHLEGVFGGNLQLGIRAENAVRAGLLTGPLIGLQFPFEFSSPSRLVLYVDAIPQVGFWSRSLDNSDLPARTEFGVQVLTGIRLEI